MSLIYSKVSGEVQGRFRGGITYNVQSKSSQKGVKQRFWFWYRDFVWFRIIIHVAVEDLLDLPICLGCWRSHGDNVCLMPASSAETKVKVSASRLQYSCRCWCTRPGGEWANGRLRFMTVESRGECACNSIRSSWAPVYGQADADALI